MEINEREEFEKWFFETFGEPSMGIFWSEEMECYTTTDQLLISDMDFANDLYDAWKARANLGDKLKGIRL